MKGYDKDLESKIDEGVKLYEKGDYPRALEIFRMAAAREYPRGWSNLTWAYHEGKGVAKDEQEVKRLFSLIEASALQGNVVGQNALGCMYYDGWGVAKNNAEAVKWYRKAAEQGHVRAQVNLGITYAEDQGIPMDGAEAIKWLHLAIEQQGVIERARAQVCLGVIYERDQNMIKGYKKAVKLYRLAAEQEDAVGQVNLGVMYQRGLGVPKDDAEGVKWYRLAAEQGCDMGQYRLGFMYEYNLGVARNPFEVIKGYFSSSNILEAAKWYFLSSEQGFTEATRALNRLYQSGRVTKKEVLAIVEEEKRQKTAETKHVAVLAETTYREQEAESRLRAAEEEKKQKAAEAKRVADLAETIRLAQEAESKLRAAEEEKRQKAAEAKRVADLAETTRLAQEAESKSRAAEEEKRQKAAEAKRAADLAETTRLAQEAESKLRAAEEEKRQQAVEAKRAAELAAVTRKAAEAESRLCVIEEEKRQKAVEVKQLTELAEVTRKAEEAESRLRAAEEEKRQKAAEAKHLAELAEITRKAEAAESRLRAAQEAFDQLALKEASKVKREASIKPPALPPRPLPHRVASVRDEAKQSAESQIRPQAVSLSENETPLVKLDSKEQALAAQVRKRQLRGVLKMEDDVKKSNAVINYKNIRLGAELGSGGYGKVYKGDWCGTTVAVKELLSKKLSKEAEDNFEHEAAMMLQLRHPNILPLYGIILAPRYYMVIEYMARGSLYDVLHGGDILKWPRRYSIALDVARGLAYLHNLTKQILHRDLKSANILLDGSYVAKLADFGLSRVKEVSSREFEAGMAGTHAWIAPELLSGARFTAPCDVYSLGMVFWEILTRAQPYATLYHEMGLLGFLAEGKREDIPPNAPKVFTDIMQRCWAQNPKDRPTAQAVCNFLSKHPIHAHGESGLSPSSAGKGRFVSSSSSSSAPSSAAEVSLGPAAAVSSAAKPSSEKSAAYTGQASSPAIVFFGGDAGVSKESTTSALVENKSNDNGYRLRMSGVSSSDSSSNKRSQSAVSMGGLKYSGVYSSVSPQNSTPMLSAKTHSSASLSNNSGPAVMPAQNSSVVSRTAFFEHAASPALQHRQLPAVPNSASDGRAGNSESRLLGNR